MIHTSAEGERMMKRTTPLHGYFFVVAAMMVLALLLSACQLPAGQPAPTEASEQELQTQGVQTLEAQLTEQAGLILPATQTQAAAEPSATVGQPTANQLTVQPNTVTPTLPPATATATQPQPSATPESPTETPTTVEPTATPTLAVSTITGVIDTNCRQGPGSYYEIISGLRAGKTSSVYGIDTSGAWWFIQRPGGKANEYCWVAAKNTNVDGTPDQFPVVPPYPAQLDPAPSQWYYNITSVNIHTCNVPTVFVGLINNGFTTFESSRVEIYDASSGQVLDDQVSNAPFTSSERDCGGGFTAFPPNTTGFVQGAAASGITGHWLAANVTLCKSDDLQGTCFFQSITFVMP
jgi:hypothetical protein